MVDMLTVLALTTKSNQTTVDIIINTICGAKIFFPDIQNN
jgi:hypothetical protein